MRIVRRIVGAVILVLVIAVGLQFVASESGEVVVLRTSVGGEDHDTRVWIVDDRGQSWLRAGQSASGWYQRILENPDIEVERGGDRFAYRAFPVEGGPKVSHINALMARKYGWADGYIGAMFDRTDSVAIRLDPR